MREKGGGDFNQYMNRLHLKVFRMYCDGWGEMVTLDKSNVNEMFQCLDFGVRGYLVISDMHLRFNVKL